MSNIIIQANPGFYLLDWVDEGTPEQSVWKDPIVAWEITTHGYAIPISTEPYTREERESLPILTPDGTVIEAGSGFYDSLANWLKERDK